MIKTNCFERAFIVLYEWASDLFFFQSHLLPFFFSIYSCWRATAKPQWFRGTWGTDKAKSLLKQTKSSWRWILCGYFQQEHESLYSYQDLMRSSVWIMKVHCPFWRSEESLWSWCQVMAGEFSSASLVRAASPTNLGDTEIEWWHCSSVHTYLTQSFPLLHVD